MKLSGEPVSSTRMLDVGEELSFEALLDVAGGDELAFAAGEGRVVDREDDGDGGLVDLDGRQRLGIFERAEALADGDAGDAGDGDDIADRGLGGVFALEAVEGEELGDLDGLEGAVELGEVDLLAVLERAVEDATDGEAAEVVGVVEVGDEDLEVAVGGAGSGAGWSGRSARRGAGGRFRAWRDPWWRCRPCRWCR